MQESMWLHVLMVVAATSVVVGFFWFRLPLTDKRLVLMERYHANRGTVIRKYPIRGEESSPCDETKYNSPSTPRIDIDDPAPAPVRNELDEHAEVVTRPRKRKRSRVEGMCCAFRRSCSC
jgi:hypothetical protein